MNKLLLLVFFIGQTFLVHAQDPNYKYVRVPEEFEFLEEENKYRLNELTAFLFEKHGYENVLYKDDAPPGTAPCEILTANVENHSSLFRSRLKVTLEDCNQEIVFTSEKGGSKEKEYQKSYHEALRNAFRSVEKFASSMEEVSQGKGGSVSIPEDQSVQRKSTGIEKEQKVRSTAPDESEVVNPVQTFRNGEDVYQLKKNSSGYSLFDGNGEQFATLLKSGSGVNYVYNSELLQGNAFFDAAGDLVVEYVDPKTGQLVSIRYHYQS